MSVLPLVGGKVSRQCRRGHHGDCADALCDCSCHPGGAVEVPDPTPVPPPDPIIPETEPVAPPPEPDPPRAKAPRKRAARPAGTVTPPAMRAPRKPVVPLVHRHEIHVDADVARAVDAIPDGELRVLLCGLSEFMVGVLMVDRHTVGGRWRIAQEVLA